MFQESFEEIKHETYNTNVFKSGVELVMPDAQKLEEEQKVRKLGEFLKETAVVNLIKNMQKNDGVPTDSPSMSQFFH